MEPATDRVRRVLGFVLATVLFTGFLGGIALFGQYVGQAVGEGVVGQGKTQEQMIVETPVMDPSGKIIGPHPLKSPRGVAQQPAPQQAPARGTPVGVASSLKQP
jgi:hypothetical protein